MRLLPGQNEKIDQINKWVEQVKYYNDGVAMTNLLDAFHPLILKICRKWSIYFNDESHNLKSMDSLIADAQYWMWKYTIEKYTIDGEATYNNFISKHLTQRIRYIYETELKYFSKIILPDPDKNSDISGDKCEAIEHVIYNYSSGEYISMDDELINKECQDHRDFLVDKILDYINDPRHFSKRDAYIIIEHIYNNRTHVSIANELGISRTRVSQKIAKLKGRIRSYSINFVKENMLYDKVY